MWKRIDTPQKRNQIIERMAFRGNSGSSNSLLGSYGSSSGLSSPSSSSNNSCSLCLFAWAVIATLLLFFQVNFMSNYVLTEQPSFPPVRNIIGWSLFYYINKTTVSFSIYVS